MTSNCKHIKIPYCDNNYYFCKICGIVLSDKVRSLIKVKLKAVKPAEYFYSPETPNMEIYIRMFRESYECLFKGMNSTYISKRATGVKYIHAMCSKLEFRKQTFYLAQFYLDIIYSNANTNYLNLELASVCCVILAGKSK